MPLPLNRVLEITQNVYKIEDEYYDELSHGVSERREHEIMRDWKLVMKIERVVLKPYAALFRPYLDEDTLRYFGLD